MIELDPSKRPNIKDCLQMWSQSLMPKSFSSVFFQLSSAFVRPQYLFSDLKVALIRKYMPSIWRTCFDSNLSPAQVNQMFYEPIERTIFEKIRDDFVVDHNDVIIPRAEDIDQFTFVGHEDALEPFQQGAEDKASSIVVINWLGTFI